MIPVVRPTAAGGVTVSVEDPAAFSALAAARPANTQVTSAQRLHRRHADTPPPPERASPQRLSGPPGFKEPAQ